MSDTVDRVARAMWEVRRANAGLVPVSLEEWGDGSIPKANGILDEARAAIEAMRPEFEMIQSAYSPMNDDTIWIDDRTPLAQYVDSIINRIA